MEKDQIKAMMFWKLCLGNPNDVMFGQTHPSPKKDIVPNADTYETIPISKENIREVTLSFPITEAEMQVLRRGHIPHAQEDHWYMYTDEEYIRYFRSWTGVCSFEAHYMKVGDGYIVDRLRMNKDLAQFGVNGDESGEALFKYLIAAETKGDAETAWQNYLDEWDKIYEKYKDN